MKKTSTDKLDYFCAHCGIALYKHEVCATVRGEFIKWDDRESGEVGIDFCSECWTKITTHTQEDPSESKMRRLELDNLPRQETKKLLTVEQAIEEFLAANPDGFRAPDGTNTGI